MAFCIFFPESPAAKVLGKDKSGFFEPIFWGKFRFEKFKILDFSQGLQLCLATLFLWIPKKNRPTLRPRKKKTERSLSPKICRPSTGKISIPIFQQETVGGRNAWARKQELETFGRTPQDLGKGQRMWSDREIAEDLTCGIIHYLEGPSWFLGFQLRNCSSEKLLVFQLESTWVWKIWKQSMNNMLVVSHQPQTQNICASPTNWIMNPQSSGWKLYQRFENHHLGP